MRKRKELVHPLSCKRLDTVVRVVAIKKELINDLDNSLVCNDILYHNGSMTVEDGSGSGEFRSEPFPARNSVTYTITELRGISNESRRIQYRVVFYEFLQLLFRGSVGVQSSSFQGCFSREKEGVAVGSEYGIPGMRNSLQDFRQMRDPGIRKGFLKNSVQVR